MCDMDWCSVFGLVCAQFECRAIEKLPLSRLNMNANTVDRARDSLCVPGCGAWWLREIVSIPFDERSQIKDAAHAMLRRIMRRLFQVEAEVVSLVYMPNDTFSRASIRRQCLIRFDGNDRMIQIFVFREDNSRIKIDGVDEDYVSMTTNDYVEFDPRSYHRKYNHRKYREVASTSTVTADVKVPAIPLLPYTQSITSSKVTQLLRRLGLPTRRKQQISVNVLKTGDANVTTTTSAAAAAAAAAAATSVPAKPLRKKRDDFAQQFPFASTLQPYAVVLFMELIRRNLTFEVKEPDFQSVPLYDRDRETVTNAIVRYIERGGWIVLVENRSDNGMYVFQVGDRLLFQWKDMQHLLPSGAVRSHMVVNRQHFSLIDLYNECRFFYVSGDTEDYFRDVNLLYLCNFDIIYERIVACMVLAESKRCGGSATRRRRAHTIHDTLRRSIIDYSEEDATACSFLKIPATSESSNLPTQGKAPKRGGDDSVLTNVALRLDRPNNQRRRRLVLSAAADSAILADGYFRI